jgi:hypothetical protein
LKIRMGFARLGLRLRLKLRLRLRVRVVGGGLG